MGLRAPCSGNGSPREAAHHRGCAVGGSVGTFFLPRSQNARTQHKDRPAVGQGGGKDAVALAHHPGNGSLPEGKQQQRHTHIRDSTGKKDVAHREDHPGLNTRGDQRCCGAGVATAPAEVMAPLQVIQDVSPKEKLLHEVAQEGKHQDCGNQIVRHRAATQIHGDSPIEPPEGRHHQKRTADSRGNSRTGARAGSLAAAPAKQVDSPSVPAVQGEHPQGNAQGGHPEGQEKPGVGTEADPEDPVPGAEAPQTQGGHGVAKQDERQQIQPNPHVPGGTIRQKCQRYHRETRKNP